MTGRRRHLRDLAPAVALLACLTSPAALAALAGCAGSVPRQLTPSHDAIVDPLLLKALAAAGANLTAARPAPSEIGDADIHREVETAAKAITLGGRNTLRAIGIRIARAGGKAMVDVTMLEEVSGVQAVGCLRLVSRGRYEVRSYQRAGVRAPSSVIARHSPVRGDTQMPAPDNIFAGPGFDAARRLLADRLGSPEVTVTAEQSATTPDGRLVRRIYGAVTDRPNTCAVVHLDAADAEVDLPALEAAVGRRLFTPSVGGVAVPAAARAQITVDPTVNDLTLAECAHLDERITVTVPVGSAPKADVYLLADTTASMGPVLDAVKAGAAAIVGNSGLAGFDVAYGVGNYRDFPVPVPNSYAFKPQQAPTQVLADVQNAINVWTADEGSDGSEGQFWALQQLATDPGIGWRPDAKRIVVWFGDAPGHDPICAAISGAPDVTEATATAALQAAGITVVAVSTTTSVVFFPAGLDDDPTKSVFDYTVCTVGGTPGQASRVTAATGGSLTSGVDATVIVTTLAALIAAAVSTIGNVSLVPSGGITGFVTSISPSAGYGPLPGDVEHVLPFDVVWDGTTSCTDEAQVFTGTIDVVADGIVVASKAVRVTVPACRWHHVIDVLCGVQPRPDDVAGADPDRECTTVVPGRYATAVTIYNPGPCPATIEKRFAPLLLNGEPIGREPRTVGAKPFARIVLQPGEATMDDCCALDEVVRLVHSRATLGVLDVVSDRPLVVTGIYTSTGQAAVSGADVHTRTVTPYRD
jgi:hypothetical protein